MQTPGKHRERALLGLLLSLTAVLAGCLRTGPKTVGRDRFDYNTAIGDSLKDQTLPPGRMRPKSNSLSRGPSQ